MPRQRIDDDFLSDGADGIDEDDYDEVLSNAEKIVSMTEEAHTLKRFANDVQLLLRMVRDFATGDYTGVSFKTIGAVTFSLLYIILPFDACFDYLPMIGFADDALLIALMIHWLRTDIERYRAWHNRNGDKPPVAAPKSTHRNR